ncbi:MAG: Hpt domain-containing protein, partial [Bacteroidota bacterium]
YLESIAEGDKSVIKDLISIFLEQIPEFVDGLEKGFAERQWLDVAAVAHKAKSSVISMGMEDLGNRDLKNLELMAKEMYVRQIQDKKNPDPSEEREAEQLAKNLEGYDKERQVWIKENANHETMADIIEKFKAVCRKAETELKSEIQE